MKRNLLYLLSHLLLPVWVAGALWSCQSHDNPIIEPADDGEEVEVEVLISTRATGPSDGYVGDLIVMAFRCEETKTDDRGNYTFAYYSNVYAGEITNEDTGERKARFLIKKEKDQRQRFVFLANIYACNIYPHIFSDAEITAGIEMQDALSYYTHFPYRRRSATPNDTIPGWSTSAGGQNEPFPMCGETIHSYTFDDIEAGKLFILNEDTGKEDEKVYLYRMAAKIEIQFTKQVIKDMDGEVKKMTLYNTRGKGYVGYNFANGYINSKYNHTTSIGSNELKTLKAWPPPTQTDCDYEQVYGIVPIPGMVPANADDGEYIMKVDGPVYINEAEPNIASNDWRFGFTASDADETEYFLRLDGFHILRNCHYTIRINEVIKGSLSATLEVQEWTQVKVDEPKPLPL